jgi:hypothetical protein
MAKGFGQMAIMRLRRRWFTCPAQRTVPFAGPSQPRLRGRGQFIPPVETPLAVHRSSATTRAAGSNSRWLGTPTPSFPCNDLCMRAGASDTGSVQVSSDRASSRPINLRGAGASAPSSTATRRNASRWSASAVHHTEHSPSATATADSATWPRRLLRAHGNGRPGPHPVI